MSIDFSQEEAQTTPLMTTSLLGEDEGEGSLRPKRLTEYIGQEKAKENLSVFIDAAKMRQEPLDHVLLHGPPGLGKTTLSGIIANEMGVNLKVTSGPAIEKPGEMAAILNNLQEGDVLFVDEIHRLNRQVEEGIMGNWSMRRRMMEPLWMTANQEPTVSPTNRRISAWCAAGRQEKPRRHSPALRRLGGCCKG